MSKEKVKSMLNKAKETSEKAGTAVAETAINIAESTKKNVDEKVEKHEMTSLEKKQAKLEKQKAELEKEIEELKNMEEEPKEKLAVVLENSINDYNMVYTDMNDRGLQLYIERSKAMDLIDNIEYIINSIANKPKEFEADIEFIKTEKEKFKGASDFAKAEVDSVRQSAFSAGGGVAAGAAVASIAPTAAMWIATTFGTASTGTAISALSGVAAKSAALAWLGGGAVAAGGGGMAGGSALLALAGPIGWGIAGFTLLGSIALFAAKKRKNDKEMFEEIEKVKVNTEIANETLAKIKLIISETTVLFEELKKEYNGTLKFYEKDYNDIPKDGQLKLGALVNNTKALSITLEKTI